MKKIPVLGFVAVLLVGIVAVSAFAFHLGGIGGKKMMKTSSDGMIKALEEKDYDAYLEALEDSDRAFMTGKLSEEEFMFRAEHHQLRAEKKAGMQEKKEAVRSALYAEDYEAWLSAIEDCPRESVLKETINQDNFKLFAEFSTAMEQRDFEKAEELAEELGIDMYGMHGMRMIPGKILMKQMHQW